MLGERPAWYGRAMHPNQATVDHIIPRCRGGSHEAGNTVLCCALCNYSKQRYTALEYLFLGNRWRPSEWDAAWRELRRRLKFAGKFRKKFATKCVSKFM